MTGALTVREVAELSGTSIGMVKKAAQQGKLEVRKVGARAVMDPRSVLAMTVLKHIDARLPAPALRRIRKLVYAPTPVAGEAELSGALFVRITEKMIDSYREALDYVRARDAHVEGRADVLGGTPVIKGTRLSVYAVAARVAGGDSLRDLQREYPELPPEALRAAATYGRLHPRRGRPARPWRSPAA